MTRNYDFDYRMSEAGASFTVDTEKFTADDANEYLRFFVWEYDKKADPIDELMKKYAIKAISIATYENYNTIGVMDWFANQEGLPPVDGSMGIMLTSVDQYIFCESDLDIEVKTV